MGIKVCPHHDELQSFRGGTLSLDRHLAVAKHLKACDACRKLVSAMPTPCDDTPLNAGPETFAPHPVGDTGEAEPLATRIGPYRVVRVLGRGGMGVVYEAEHEMLKNRVALKILPRSAVNDPRVMARFRREWEAVGRLVHPNVVRALHADDVGGTAFLAMELIPGPDLGKVVHRHGPLAPADAAEAVRQAALGLAHAHAQGVIHRDVKPSNILLAPDGVVKLLDLGLARFAAGTSDSRLSGQHYLGTADYMAPEQWEGVTANPRTDIYSLGCVLFFLLTGKPPFAAPEYPSPRAKMRAHHEVAVPAVAGPPDLTALLSRMLAKTPADRPQTAMEVADRLALQAALSQLDRVAVAAGVDAVGAFADGDATAPLPIIEKQRKAAADQSATAIQRFWNSFRRPK